MTITIRIVNSVSITGAPTGTTFIGDVLGASQAGGSWYRDGNYITTSDTYTVVEADDGATLTYRVGAITSSGVVATYEPPEAAGMGTMDFVTSRQVSFDLSSLFTGEIQSYSIEETGVDEIDNGYSIDGDTLYLDGLLSTYVDQDLIVQASNTGGAVSETLRLNVTQGENVTLRKTSDPQSMSSPVFPGINQSGTADGTDLTEAELDEQDFTVLMWIYIDPDKLDNDTIFNWTKSSYSAGWDVWFKLSEVSIRRVSGMSVTNITVPDPTVTGWTLVAWRLHRKPENVGTATRTISIRRSDGEFLEWTGAYGKMNWSNPEAINFKSDWKGQFFDYCMVTGDPEPLFDFLTGDRALDTDPVIDPKFVDEYDFGSDPDCSLIDHIKFRKYDPAAPSNPDAYDNVDDVTHITSTTGTGNWFEATDTYNEPDWSPTPPFGEPPIPEITAEPTMTRLGDVFSVDPGAATGDPTPTLDAKLYWNGEDVTSEIVAGDWTKPTGEDGQVVYYVNWSSIYGDIDRTLYEWVEPAVAPSSDDPATSWQMRRVAYDCHLYEFNRPVTVYRYMSGINLINGDPVGGEIGVSAISGDQLVTYYPQPRTLGWGRRVHGMMKQLRLRKNTPSGMDSENGSKYDAAINESFNLPINLVAGQSLIMSKSNEQANTIKGSSEQFTCLSVTAAVKEWDTLRPNHFHTAADDYGHNFIRLSDADDTLLPGLDTSGITPPADLLNSTNMYRMLRVGLDKANHYGDWMQSNSFHRGVYGRDFQGHQASIYTHLMSDQYGLDAQTDKAALVAVLQQGHDIYHGWVTYIIDYGGKWPWSIDGGHNVGRKMPILFAGKLLGHAGMLGIMDTADPTNSQASLQEDCMTVHVDANIVEMASTLNPYGTYVDDPVDDLAWRPQYRSGGAEADEYVQGMIDGPHPMPEWRGSPKVNIMNAHFGSHPYRSVGNHEDHHHTVLAIKSMGLETEWAHDAFIDYHYRHMALKRGEADPWILQGGAVGGPFYTAVDGAGAGNPTKWDGDYDFEMLQAHYPVTVAAPWV